MSDKNSDGDNGGAGAAAGAAADQAADQAADAAAGSGPQAGAAGDTAQAAQADQAPGGKPQISPDLSAILGQAAWVMMHSPVHKHMFVGDLEWLLVPPIGLKQFRLWRRETIPVAFASWAFLGEEQAARLASGVRRLAPADWRSGEELWLIDMVCPFGGMEEAMKQLKQETFKGRKAKTVRPSPDGQGLSVVEW